MDRPWKTKILFLFTKLFKLNVYSEIVKNSIFSSCLPETDNFFGSEMLYLPAYMCSLRFFAPINAGKWKKSSFFEIENKFQKFKYSNSFTKSLSALRREFVIMKFKLKIFFGQKIHSTKFSKSFHRFWLAPPCFASPNEDNFDWGTTQNAIIF